MTGIEAQPMHGRLPLPLDVTPIRMPRATPTGGTERPVWSDYRVKVPVDCNHCETVAYETAMAGEAYAGMRKARRKRRQDGVNLLLCNEHGRAQQEKDQDDHPANGSTIERSGRGQRYIA